jgi:phage terminase small subunit
MPRRSAADLATPRFELVQSTPVDLPAPPGHLSAPSQEWWRAIVAEYDLLPHYLRLLEAACDSWERLTEARARLRREGLTLGPRRHPCINIEHEAAIRFARLLRELDLDSDAPRPEAYARPPGLRSNRRL